MTGRKSSNVDDSYNNEYISFFLLNGVYDYRIVRNLGSFMFFYNLVANK